MKSWKDRLSELGLLAPKSSVIQDCMLEEITALRTALDAAREKRDYWKQAAMKYQAAVAKRITVMP